MIAAKCKECDNIACLCNFNRRVNLEKAIEDSKYILDLKEDFDDEGSIPPTKETWEKVINFLRGLNYRIAPKIWHCHNNSIDVMFEEEGFRLVMNIESDMKATWYKDNGDPLTDKNWKAGELDLNEIDFSNFILNRL